MLPFAIEGFGGTIASEIKIGGTTVICCAPRILPKDAVIVAVPGLAPAITPVPFATTTPGAEDAHVTVLVTSMVVPSRQLAMAFSCSVLPFGIGRLGATMLIETRDGGGIVRVAPALIEPEAAVIRVLPDFFATAVPDLSIGAISGLPLVQVTVDERSCLVPSP